ncbi:MAG: sugar transferase [Proteobacteria bacterium]|nr:sugar transferase [Pseudomonadota bacterium]MBU1570924.1 sugar transferase [Pseudomonadota bacterium]
MKKLFDVITAILLLILLSIPMTVISIMIKMTSRGPVLYWSDRVGRNNTLFRMPKFRSMRTDTPPLATHLLADPDRYITAIGRFIRKTSLDELPQILSVLKGDMSFVGPRPALFNQDDLVALRTSKGIHTLVPGITGWAQINGRDELPIPVKVDYDLYYLRHRSFILDLKILMLTLFNVIAGKGVTH